MRTRAPGSSVSLTPEHVARASRRRLAAIERRLADFENSLVRQVDGPRLVAGLLACLDPMARNSEGVMTRSACASNAALATSCANQKNLAIGGGEAAAPIPNARSNRAGKKRPGGSARRSSNNSMANAQKKPAPMTERVQIGGHAQPSAAPIPGSCVTVCAAAARQKRTPVARAGEN